MARSSSSDTLEKFRFIVSWTNTPANGDTPAVLERAGFLSVQMPKKSVTKIQYREGNDPDIYSLSAGLATMEDITLERGLFARGPGATSTLYQWMSAVQGVTAGYGSAKRSGAPTANVQVDGTIEAAPNSSGFYRKTITITVLDRTGAVARKYEIYNAFPVAFNPGSDLNAGEDGEKMIESVTLAYEDFQEVGID